MHRVEVVIFVIAASCNADMTVNARQMFFLATPEMSRMSAEYTMRQFHKEMVSQLTEDHDISLSEVTRENSAGNKLKATILDNSNPFAVEGDRLHNMMTHAHVLDELVEHILNVNDTGQKMYEDYVTERINGNISLWSKVTKGRQQNVHVWQQDNRHRLIQRRRRISVGD